MARGMQWLAVAGFVASLALTLAALPLQDLEDALSAWVRGLGIWAPLAFALAYGLAATLLIPASALSLAAGVLFGVWLGTAVVWSGAVLACALSFLIARYAARARVEQFARTRPRFAAVDRAVGEQGWRIVALMRLSPVFPFSLQNYLFGVTAIGFWPCWLASAACIVPGTFLFVYLGFAGGEAATAVGGAGDAGGWRLALQLVGLGATLAVTIAVARLAAKAIAAQAPGAASDHPPRAEPSGGTPSRARSVWLLAVAAVCLLASLLLYLRRGAMRSWLRPPQVQLVERYAGAAGTADFAHAPFDKLLRRHVNVAGLVDYSGLAADAPALDAYIQALGQAPFAALGRNGKLALLLNAYNAFTLRLVLEHLPVDSIRAIPAAQRWQAARWRVADGTYSLDQIENALIRPSFRDTRIHFALVCAALGCPPLRPEAYAAPRLEQQLEQQAEAVHADERWFRFDEAAGLVWLAQVYNWYASDFQQVHGSLLAAAAQYSPALRRALEAGRSLQIRWLPYDWGLNSQPRGTRGPPGTAASAR